MTQTQNTPGASTGGMTVWNGTKNFEQSGDYYCVADTITPIEIWLDNSVSVPVYSSSNQTPPLNSIYVDAGEHTVTVKYGVGEKFQLQWFFIPSTQTNTIERTGTGLKATYHNGTEQNYGNGGNFDDPVVLTRIDPIISFRWNEDDGIVPGPGVNSKFYSVRWTGKVRSLTAGDYKFWAFSDDGVRLYFNNVQVINEWGDGVKSKNIVVRLDAEKLYPIQLEYWQRGGPAYVYLYWMTPQSGDKWQLVPTEQLYPDA